MWKKNKNNSLFVFMLLALLPICSFALSLDNGDVYSNNITSSNGIELLNGAKFENDPKFGEVLKAENTGYGTITPTTNVSAKEGSISLWVKPLWDSADKTSHTILSMGWDHPKKSYLAISWGWWEPIGSGRLYFVASNQELIHCSAPFNFDLNEWSFITATWKSGAKGFCKIFVDGAKVAGVDTTFTGDYVSKFPIYLGSDKGTTEKNNRLSNLMFHKLMLKSTSLSDTDAKNLFVAENPDVADVDSKKLKWMDNQLQNSNANLDQSTNYENRIIFDESITWAKSKKNTDAILNRIKAAGFNVYVPCIWHGGGTYYPTKLTKPNKTLTNIAKGEDPLKYLLDKAHSMGIQVHPWMTVAYREDNALVKYFDSGTPKNAFDVQNLAFREFIQKLVTDVVNRYPVDGINLDYIRSVGFCVSSKCKTEYKLKYGRSLDSDILLTKIPGITVESLIDWNTIAVSDIVNRIYTSTKAINPGLIISIDGHPLNKDLILQGQDSITWANKNWIDVIFNMDYKERLDVETADKVQASLQDKRKMIMLLSLFDFVDTQPVQRAPEAISKYINFIRNKWPNTGIAFYHYPQLGDSVVEKLRSSDFSLQKSPSWPIK
jgi:uncharacterized lipoprotein YddW (UPF0748 family)